MDIDKALARAKPRPHDEPADLLSSIVAIGTGVAVACLIIAVMIAPEMLR